MSARLQPPLGNPDDTVSPSLSRGDVSAALERILASEAFCNARRPSQFLRFIVESALAGEQKRIKEYLIGVEVFERPSDYDPKTDPVVRIEAGRLRKKLAEYYAGPGGSDPVIVDLPKGGYVPVIRPRVAQVALSPAEPTSAPRPEPIPIRSDSPISKFIFLAVVFVIVGAMLFSAYYLRQRAKQNAPTAVAVLPFLNLSPNPATGADDYLSDGITEDLTTTLAQLKGLRVVAATSSFQFRGKSEDVRKIGQMLNASAILEGSLTKSGSNLRIDAQLVNAKNGYSLWSKAYEIRDGDLSTSEQDIVQEATRVLGFSDPATAHSVKRDTTNSEAHELYLQGRYLFSKRTAPEMNESIHRFERAIAADPNYALAYSGLADAYAVMAVNRQLAPAVAVPRAKEALEHALQLDPNLAQAHATLGLIESQCEWNWRGAEAEFRKAVELQPNYAEAHHWAGLNYMTMGQFAAAEAEFRQAQVLDPLSLMITEGLAENYYYARRYDDSINTVNNMPHDGTIGWVVRANSLVMKGKYAEMIKSMPAAIAAEDPTRVRLTAVGLTLSGDRSAGMKIFAELERNQQHVDTLYGVTSPTDLGMGYAAIGENERALFWLEKAYEEHDPPLAEIKVSPFVDGLRSDARFQELLRKSGISN
jgi:TolB-like protein/tetratricopeptide (TPR) repeat protein